MNCEACAKTAEILKQVHNAMISVLEELLAARLVVDEADRLRCLLLGALNFEKHGNEKERHRIATEMDETLLTLCDSIKLWRKRNREGRGNAARLLLALEQDEANEN